MKSCPGQREENMENSSGRGLPDIRYMTEKKEKILAVFMMILLIACLLPVMYVGRYNHATGDDYYYGVQTRLAWEKSGSMADVVSAAAKGVYYEYGRWQGTYSAMFFMYLPPNWLSDSAYGFVTAVLLILLTGSIFYLWKPVVCNWLGGSTALWIIAASGISLLCIETVPSQGETFFWYNGAMYYTGFFAVTLFSFGLLLRYLAGKTGEGKWRVPVLMLSAAFLAGGNYVSLLPCMILLVLITAGLLCRKDPKAWGAGLTTVTMAVGFIVSAAAPGNRMRQSGMWKIPAWKAVLKSLRQGLAYMGAWTGIWCMIFAILITLLLWKYLKKCSFRFPCPAVAIGLMYGIFCSMSCPTFYTMNSTGPARVVSIVYYGYILFFFTAYGYLLGYVQRVWERRKKEPAGGVRKLGAAGIIFLLLIQIVFGNLHKLTTVKAVGLLVSGEAKAYGEEYRQRIDMLRNDAIQDVLLPAYENRPDMLYVGDFSGDPLDPNNQAVAEFFHKNSVAVIYE